MGRVHSARASVGRGTCGACKLSTRLPQSEFPSERNLFELGLYEEPRTPLWLSQRQTLERLRHGDPGCGDDRRHEDFDFADADEVDAIAAKMTSLSVGDSSLTSLERTWPRQRSLGRAARDLNPGRRTKTRQLSLEVLVRVLLDDNDGRCYMATHNITQHGADRNVKGSSHQTSSPQQLLAVAFSACCGLCGRDVCTDVLRCVSGRCWLCHSKLFSEGNSTRMN